MGTAIGVDEGAKVGQHTYSAPGTSMAYFALLCPRECRGKGRAKMNLEFFPFLQIAFEPAFH
ncbi:uncharacterized protein PHALS_01387 [Plasmopara halstedii]|uniref:Uncharacterized protein n=1 Tax=Plasmopara halstedii TaxID=4781 RepID=A0A0P1AVC7_PLAHL|nr:uncharacterized protein PHALS_01387 [Plasmopara halstedii]CEG45060.1 hypothetical protein PHALS_01387 [Plasmopara halstedii]|eukprot:XP_024581429.1 hypothetical protein PHALS_01387 [Plasmopara halstedii]